MLDRFADLVTERRGVALLLVVVLLGAAVGAAVVRGVPVDFTPQALFTTFEDQQAADARFQEQFGSTENVAMVIVRADDVLRRDVADYVHGIGLALRDREFADRVESMTLVAIPRAGAPGELLVDSPVDGDDVDEAEASALREALAGTPLLDGMLVSEDRDTAVIAVFLADGYEKTAVLQPAMRDIQALLAARPPPQGATAEVGGLPYIRVYMVERFIQDQRVLVPGAMLVCGLILLLSFRWLPGVVLPSATVVFTVVLVVGAMALAQEPFNIINQVVPTLIIVIGISDAIHLVSRYQEELGATAHRKAAAKRTVIAMTAACFLTSATTAVGFGSLVVSRTEILARFGVLTALAVMVAYAVTMTFMPAALSLVRAPRLPAGGDTGVLERASERVVARVIRHPWVTVAGSVVFAAALAASAATVRIDTTLLEGFPERDPVHQQTRMLEAELDGVLPLEVSLSSDVEGRFDDPEVLNAVIRVQDWLAGEPQVLSTQSYGDLLREVWAVYTGDPAKREAEFGSRAQVAQLASLLESARPNPLEPYVTADRRHLRLNVQLRDDGSVATLGLAGRLQARLDEELGPHPDMLVELTGDAYSGSLGLDSLIRDMASSLGMAFVIIFGIMTLLFRSFRIGLISVPPNVLPLVGTMAYMAVRDIALNTTTVVIFSISIGLAVDDTIHMLARFREERAQGYGIDEALLRAARGSGRAVIVTSVMLGAGMLVMLLSSFTPVRLFGELIAVTLTMCLIGDLILLPALVKLFARRKPGEA